MLIPFTLTEKVQAEIDQVIGQSRLPTMADRADMPYTDAVIHEIQRIGNIAPLGLPRYTTKDVQLGDYFIPKVNLPTPLNQTSYNSRQSRKGFKKILKKCFSSSHVILVQ